MTVSLIQTATSLPLFLVHDPRRRADRPRRFAPAAVRREFRDPRLSRRFSPGLVSSLGVATPMVLLGATFLLGVAGALAAPAWVSIAPLLVPTRDLDSATAANTAGYNISRAVGPAIGGLVIAWAGVSAPFWIYAVSNVAVLAALLWWRPPRTDNQQPARRTVDDGDSHRRAPCAQQSASARDAGQNARVLSVRQRLLGAAAAHRARAAGAGRGVLWPAAGAIGVGAIVGSAVALLAKGAGSGRIGWSRWRASGRRRRWCCSGLSRDPVERAAGGRPRRRDVDLDDFDALCLGPGRVARLGARARSGDLPDVHFRRDDLRQRASGDRSRRCAASTSRSTSPPRARSRRFR